MNFFNKLCFSPSFKLFNVSLSIAQRQRAFLSLLLSLFLPACNSQNLPYGISYDTNDFKGIVVADDPNATIVAKDVLQNGGNAFDAATAMAFTLAVTLPSRAGIGSSGFCQVYSPDNNLNSILNFIYQDELSSFAVPAMPRAMMALHAKGGNWKWESVLSPAEKLAKRGFVVSKTLEIDANLVPTEYNAQFKEGNIVLQQDLASSIALLRSKGIAGLYTSSGAKRFLEAAELKKIAFSPEKLRNFVPIWQEPQKIDFDNETIYFPKQNILEQDIQNLWENYQNNEYTSIKNQKNIPDGTGFAVADANGNAVTCVFSMGSLFGTQTKLTGTGILLAKPLKIPTDNLATILVVNDNVNEFRYAGYASSTSSTENILKTTADTLINKNQLKINFEKNENIPENSAAIYCPEGLPPNPESCTFSLDNRSFGMGYRIGDS